MIYKYPLQLTNSQELHLPKNAVILSVQNQRESLVMWALVDSNEKRTVRRVFRVYETGSEHIPASNLRFIDTVQFDKGEYVVHVFEEML